MTHGTSEMRVLRIRGRRSNLLRVEAEDSYSAVVSGTGSRLLGPRPSSIIPEWKTPRGSRLDRARNMFPLPSAWTPKAGLSSETES